MAYSPGTFAEPAVEVSAFCFTEPQKVQIAEEFPYLSQPAEGKPGILSEYLTDYFSEPGMTLHRTDMTGDVELFFCPDPGDCAGILQADWSLRVVRTGPGWLYLVLVVHDRPGGDLQAPFIFNLSEPAHHFDMVRFLRQYEVMVYLLAFKGGGLGLAGSLKLALTAERREGGAADVAKIMEEVKR